jgi:hypothetical protein
MAIAAGAQAPEGTELGLQTASLTPFDAVRAAFPGGRQVGVATSAAPGSRHPCAATIEQRRLVVN